MSLSRPVHPSGNDRKRKANGDFANNFPLLALPPELKSKIFSFLGPKDRLKARVCKELNVIEAESKYYVEKLSIYVYQRRDYFYRIDRMARLRTSESEELISLCQDDFHSIDGVKRIAQNASIGTLCIKFGRYTKLDGEIYRLIKDFKVDNLILIMKDSINSTKMVLNRSSSFIHHLPSSCKTLVMQGCRERPLDALHEAYEAMKEGTTKLREFSEVINIPSNGDSFFLGISMENDGIHSTKDIEAYKDNNNDLHVFEGKLEIFRNRNGKEFKLTLHETDELLEEAKGKLVDHKVDVIRDPRLW